MPSRRGQHASGTGYWPAAKRRETNECLFPRFEEAPVTKSVFRRRLFRASSVDSSRASREVSAPRISKTHTAGYPRLPTTVTTAPCGALGPALRGTSLRQFCTRVYVSAKVAGTAWVNPTAGKVLPSQRFALVPSQILLVSYRPRGESVSDLSISCACDASVGNVNWTHEQHGLM